MGLADIASVPRNNNELKKWAFTHQAHHVDIIRKIFQNFGIVLDSFILDPIDPDNTDVWIYNHQIMHSEMDQVLGITGNDLTGLDWKNEDILLSWLFLHLPEHQQAGAALGV